MKPTWIVVFNISVHIGDICQIGNLLKIIIPLGYNYGAMSLDSFICGLDVYTRTLDGARDQNPKVYESPTFVSSMVLKDEKKGREIILV
jgi:hypothetical protein